MITIHGMQDSGNCYKPRLLMALLGKPFHHVEVDSLDGSTRRPAFLALNPIAKVPVLELEDGRTLPESNAILAYLGEGSAFVPADPFERATMLSWMFFEQYSHEPNVAVRRSLLVYPSRKAQATPERLAETLDGGNKALAVMETALTQSNWLVGDAPTLADIALYAYTHVADQGGFDLAAYPGIRAWLSRIEALPGYQPMTWLPGT
ncbi:glutathione S-transferase family protein [Aurantimonas sp. C2-6-R+9]|uniref:glutathione S-transferase family protein n=1 Tax=unclassified Aurantimonas TaxID=2638230 RepID=UPI002E18249C|nr:MULTISPECIES: glutathione S-transferase family protein [unclassified Aurantimonas]MEC5290866.1 glutathione S-transferase family protein [Aurantimonas sp. C2-3-R2]MEC5381043.1 glutathione S-transferase family protein [Aurantimonas sp. C2-6-R+9]MEC5412016.1 glutathione S-transferase family protein [Aurantimonas sp. C2-4-R8]